MAPPAKNGKPRQPAGRRPPPAQNQPPPSKGGTPPPKGGNGASKAPQQQDKKKKDAFMRAARADMRTLLNPLNPRPMPAIASDGMALPHTGMVTADFVVDNTKRTLLIVTNVGQSATVAWLANIDTTTGAYVDGFQLLSIPTISTPAHQGGATGIRAMKFGCTLVNCSNALKRGGRVTYINSAQRLGPIVGAGTSSASYQSVVDSIKNTPTARKVSGDDFSRPKQLVGYVVDNQAYTTFRPNVGAYTGDLAGDQFLGHVLTPTSDVLYFSHDMVSRPMSTVAYVFEPTVESQDYSVVIRSSYYTRWPLTSVPGQSMSQIPTAPPGVVNGVRDHAESTAQEMTHVAEGGALGVVASSLASGLRDSAYSAFSHAGEAFMAGASEASELALLAAA